MTVARRLLLFVAVASSAAVPALRGNDNAAVAAALVALAGLVVVYLVKERWRSQGSWLLELPVLVVLVYAFWHLALWPFVLLGRAGPSRLRLLQMAAGDATTAALALCVAGLAWLSLGALAGMGRSRLAPLGWLPARSWVVHFVLVLGTALIALYFVVKGHRAMGRYSVVFTEADPARRLYNLGVLLVLGGLGAVLVFGRSLALRAVGVFLLALPGIVVTTLVGSRWVLFSAFLAALAAWSMRGRKLPALRLAVLFVALILAGTWIKEYRRYGVAPDLHTLFVKREAFPVVEFFQEIGQTFVVVARTVDRYGQEESFRYGATIFQAGLSVVPSGARLAGALEERPMYELARELFPEEFGAEGFTIGFSVVAELFLNFGVPGVAVGMWLIGYGFGAWYRRALVRRRARVIFPLLAVFAIFVFGMRNDFMTWVRYAVWSGLALSRRGPAVRWAAGEATASSYGRSPACLTDWHTFRRSFPRLATALKPWRSWRWRSLSRSWCFP
ncbi:MAG: hypothetical protein KatS3mg082_3217 [Nitrospiraceae bacterium]|nr:MAG: hypothetical protein KatS3mg082_3217 [Nitrospiraceae bacterium]